MLLFHVSYEKILTKASVVVAFFLQVANTKATARHVRTCANDGSNSERWRRTYFLHTMKTKKVARQLSLGHIMAGGQASAQWFVEWESEEEQGRDQGFTKVMEDQLVWMQRVLEESSQLRCSCEGCWKCEDLEGEVVRSSLWFEDDIWVMNGLRALKRQIKWRLDIEYAPVFLIWCVFAGISRETSVDA